MTMTVEEALKIEQNWTPIQARNDLERLLLTGERPANKVIALAIKALEKQIPTKPLYIEGDYDLPLCPTCKMSLDEEDRQNVCCSVCGQVIDWEDAHGTLY